jgi:AcrR family transcriptional regulator
MVTPTVVSVSPQAWPTEAAGRLAPCRTPERHPRRILDTAWGLVRERGIAAVALADIAAATGVSRQLLYVHFENRAGLLRLWFAYLPEILPVARALEAAAVNGDEGGAAWRDRMGDLRELFGAAVGRVDGDGRLAPGWTVEAATDWVRARAQPAAFAHLVLDRAWPSGDYAERTVASILSEVVGPPA